MGWKGFSPGFDGGEGLGDGVGYAAEELEDVSLRVVGEKVGGHAYGVGYHCGEDWFFCVVGIEFGYQPHGDGHFDDENDGV